MLAMARKKGMCARVAFADGDGGGGKASSTNSRWGNTALFGLYSTSSAHDFREKKFICMEY